MMHLRGLALLVAVVRVSAQGFPATCPPLPSSPGPKRTIGVCPSDFTIIGGHLEAVHESIQPPTGLAVDPDLNIYLTYPRNSGPTPNNVVIATNFTNEIPWPSAAIQNCSAGQNASECFINVQNVVVDSLNQAWIVDSGIQPGNTSATPYGAKIMSFNLTTKECISTYVIPVELYHDNMNANDGNSPNPIPPKSQSTNH